MATDLRPGDTEDSGRTAELESERLCRALDHLCRIWGRTGAAYITGTTKTLLNNMQELGENHCLSKCRDDKAETTPADRDNADVPN